MVILSFLIISFICLIITLVLIYNYFKHHQNDKVKRVSNWFSLSFLGYLLLAILFFSWSLGYVSYSMSDFNIIYSAILMFIVLIFLKIVFLFTHDRKIYYYFIIFLIVNLFSLFITDNFYLIIIPFSYFSLLFISFNYFLVRDECKSFGYMLGAYSAFSLLSEILSIYLNGISSYFILISFLLYLILVIIFIKNIKNFPRDIANIKYNYKSKAVGFVRYFVFVLILFNLILLSSVVIHESGHIFSAKMLGCDYHTYVFDDSDSSLKTETFCATPILGLVVAIGGILLPLIISMIFYLVGGNLSRSIALIMFGSGCLISTSDLSILEVSSNLVLSIDFVAVIIIIWGVVTLSKFKFNEIF